MIAVQKENMKKLFDSVGDEELRKIAVRAADKFMARLLMMTGKNGLDSFLRITRIRLEQGQR